MMDIKTIAHEASKFVPALEALITMENPLIGSVLTSLYNAFGTNDLAQVADKIKTDPEAAPKLQKIANSYQNVVVKLEVDLSNPPPNAA